MNKNFFLGIPVFFLCACSSEVKDFEPQVPQETPKSDVWHIELIARMSDIKVAAERLDEFESVSIPLSAKISAEMSQNLLSRGTTIPLNFSGNITKRGTIKTLWKYGEGQNLVPAGLCGSYSISDWYEVSGTISVGFAGATYISTTGEYSGWSGKNIGNTQTPYQANRGTETEPEFYTFIYDIRSGGDGTTPPGGHLWVPCSQEEVKLYCDVVIPMI